MRQYPGVNLPGSLHVSNQQAGITELLSSWREGDRAAENALVEYLYPVLRGLVGAQLRRAPSGLTLSATELANEAYIRLEQQRAGHVDDQKQCRESGRREHTSFVKHNQLRAPYLALVQFRGREYTVVSNRDLTLADEVVANQQEDAADDDQRRAFCG